MVLFAFSGGVHASRFTIPSPLLLLPIFLPPLLATTFFTLGLVMPNTCADFYCWFSETSETSETSEPNERIGRVSLVVDVAIMYVTISRTSS